MLPEAVADGPGGQVGPEAGAGLDPVEEGLLPADSRHRFLLAVCVASGALTHAYHLFLYPLYTTDEGIYMEQAWSVLREGKLSPYTYFYDHAPGAWLTIAAYVSVLPMQFQTFGDAINTGRILMLLVHIGNVFLLYQIAYRLSRRHLAAVVACFFFNFSPVAVFYQREVLLDNLMVFWVLLSVYLLTKEDRRVRTAMLSGLSFGLALITKENALFFAPVIGFLLYRQVQASRNRRFALGYWGFAAWGPVSMYTLYASLKNELLPSRLNFSLSSPPADHVALLYTIWWQLNRNQGGILDPGSAFWQFSLGSWLPKDHFILMAGSAAMVFGLMKGMQDRKTHASLLIAASLAGSYTLYLIRGSVMLEFYVIPLLPFLALNIGLVLDHLLRDSSAAFRVTAAGAMMVVLAMPVGGYVLYYNDKNQLAPADLYNVPLTPMQEQELAYVREHIPTSARIIIDDDMWVPLHDQDPPYRYAHSHWKASGDPAIRDNLFHRDWQNIDYIVMSNKMRQAMVQNNGDGMENWMLDAIDNHSSRIWSLRHGDVELVIYQIDHGGGGQ
ncbi:MAG TPA: glycosyltransferase family 39 protein [Candidatus Dormibacteraeota bacterium]|nr:glycosyltransferase family 39 protein [Candidatus Dormibacteraeota bacterium]